MLKLVLSAPCTAWTRRQYIGLQLMVLNWTHLLDHDATRRLREKRQTRWTASILLHAWQRPVLAIAIAMR
eukprot:360002-Chlamydomonas_euryale.AAC.8